MTIAKQLLILTSPTLARMIGKQNCNSWVIFCSSDTTKELASASSQSIIVSMTHTNGHWNYAHQMGTDAYVGFLYLIVNRSSGQGYIGRKLYRSAGKKTKGKALPWRTYKSSAKSLLADVKELGKEFFDFYCIAEFTDKRDLHYAEVKAIMQCDALVSREWYNNHAPEIYVPPPWQNYRYRRENITTLRERSVNNAKENKRGRFLHSRSKSTMPA